MDGRKSGRLGSALPHADFDGGRRDASFPACDPLPGWPMNGEITAILQGALPVAVLLLAIWMGPQILKAVIMGPLLDDRTVTEIASQVAKVQLPSSDRRKSGVVIFHRRSRMLPYHVLLAGETYCGAAPAPRDGDTLRLNYDDALLFLIESEPGIYCAECVQKHFQLLGTLKEVGSNGG